LSAAQLEFEPRQQVIARNSPFQRYSSNCAALGRRPLIGQ